MNAGSSQDAPRQGATEARGRTATPEELRERLVHAPAPYLAGAAANPALGPDEMILLLRNRAAGASLLARIGGERKWSRLRKIQRALVRHPHTPVAVAQGLAAHLFWNDLAEIAEDLRVPPAVRHRAEELLKGKVERLALGEKIALARKASRPAIAVLRDSTDAAVLRALLRNPRLVEADATRIASGTAAPAVLLQSLAEDASWGIRRPVRLALLKNPRTPVASALVLVRTLSRQDLSLLAGDADVPEIVRVEAGRRLENNPGG